MMLAKSRPRPVAQSTARPPGIANAVAALYWKEATAAAAVLTLLLVVRLSEVWAPLGRLHPAALGAALTTGILIIRTPSKSWGIALNDRTIRWVAFYAMTIVMSAPLAIWRGGVIPTIQTLPYCFALPLVMLLCRPGRPDLDKILNWAVLGAAGYAGFVSVAGRTVNDVVGGDRLGTFGMYDSNDLAAMLAVMLQFAIGMAMRTTGNQRRAAYGSILAMTLIILRTGSRGGVVAIAVATLVLLAAQNAKRFFSLLAALLVAVPAAWVLGPDAFRVRTASMLSIQDDYTFQSDGGRIAIWKRGLGYFAERPLTGLGANGFPLREGEWIQSRYGFGSWHSAHNMYIQALTELGIFGAIALCGMLYTAWRDAAPLWRKPTKYLPNRLFRPEVFSALVSFMTSAFFLSHAYSYLLFFMVAICALARRVLQADALSQPDTQRSTGAPPPARSRVARGRRHALRPVGPARPTL